MLTHAPIEKRYSYIMSTNALRWIADRATKTEHERFFRANLPVAMAQEIEAEFAYIGADFEQIGPQARKYSLGRLSVMVNYDSRTIGKAAITFRLELD